MGGGTHNHLLLQRIMDYLELLIPTPTTNLWMLEYRCLPPCPVSCGAGEQTQVPLYTKQTPYQLSHRPQPESASLILLHSPATDHQIRARAQGPGDDSFSEIS